MRTPQTPLQPHGEYIWKGLGGALPRWGLEKQGPGSEVGTRTRRKCGWTPERGRGQGGGLEAKRALQHWTLAALNALSPGFEWIHLMFFWGSVCREYGDPLRKLDLEPEGIRLPCSRHSPQGPRDRVERAGGQGLALDISILWEANPPNWGTSPRTPSSPPSGNPESHHPHPPSSPTRWTEPGCWPDGHTGCQGGCRARSQQETSPKALGLSGDKWAHGWPCRPGNVALTRAGAQRALPMSIVCWAPQGRSQSYAQVCMDTNECQVPSQYPQDVEMGWGPRALILAEWPAPGLAAREGWSAVIGSFG